MGSGGGGYEDAFGNYPLEGGMGGLREGSPTPAQKKQIIGFAKFKSRLQALEARDLLNGRKVDVEKGSTLKAEMAKKNLHVKRVGEDVAGGSGGVSGGGGTGSLGRNGLNPAVLAELARQNMALQQQQQQHQQFTGIGREREVSAGGSSGSTGTGARGIGITGTREYYDEGPTSPVVQSSTYYSNGPLPLSSPPLLRNVFVPTSTLLPQLPSLAFSTSNSNSTSTMNQLQQRSSPPESFIQVSQLDLNEQSQNSNNSPTMLFRNGIYNNSTNGGVGGQSSTLQQFEPQQTPVSPTSAQPGFPSNSIYGNSTTAPSSLFSSNSNQHQNSYPPQQQPSLYSISTSSSSQQQSQQPFSPSSQQSQLFSPSSQQHFQTQHLFSPPSSQQQQLPFLNGNSHNEERTSSALTYHPSLYNNNPSSSSSSSTSTGVGRSGIIGIVGSSSGGGPTSPPMVQSLSNSGLPRTQNPADMNAPKKFVPPSPRPLFFRVRHFLRRTDVFFPFDQYSLRRRITSSFAFIDWTVQCCTFGR